MNVNPGQGPLGRKWAKMWLPGKLKARLEEFGQNLMQSEAMVQKHKLPQEYLTKGRVSFNYTASVCMLLACDHLIATTKGDEQAIWLNQREELRLYLKKAFGGEDEHQQ